MVNMVERHEAGVARADMIGRVCVSAPLGRPISMEDRPGRGLAAGRCRE